MPQVGNTKNKVMKSSTQLLHEIFNNAINPGEATTNSKGKTLDKTSPYVIIDCRTEKFHPINEARDYVIQSVMKQYKSTLEAWDNLFLSFSISKGGVIYFNLVVQKWECT